MKKIIFNNKIISRKLIDNFYSKIVKDKSSCHVWTGYLNKAGYGRLHINGKLIMAHRLAILLAGEKIPDGYFVCHHCDNSACCNLEHLFIGTNADNMRNMAEKNRSRRSGGKYNPMYGLYGDKHPAFGNKHTDETKKKISLSKLGKPNLKVAGENAVNSKLNKGQVLYIRNSVKTGVGLAKQFNVGTSIISAIRNGKAWKHI